MPTVGVRACENCGALYVPRLNDGRCRGCKGRVMPVDGIVNPDYPAPLPPSVSWWRRWFGGLSVKP